MDVVEFLREDPFVLRIVDFELEVWGDALTVSWLGGDGREKGGGIWRVYDAGWIMERSVPITWAEG